MNILDENIPRDQRQVLIGWRIRVRQIGYDIGRTGMADEEIITMLIQLRRPTFFTRDLRLYERSLRHRRYCLVCMAINKYEAAAFVRRLLRHKEFDTQAKRMGSVIRISRAGLWIWRLSANQEVFLDWVE
jgi:hypothetical protein